MSLLLRFSPKEGVIRSVGDAPNGILALACPDSSACWIIEAAWTPDADASGMQHMSTDTGLGPASTIIDVDDVVKACESTFEAQALIACLLVACRSSVDIYSPALEFEAIASHAQLAAATRDALQRHGFIEITEIEP